MATRRRGTARGVWRGPGFLDRREARVRGARVPFEEQMYVTTPSLAELRQAAGITDQQAEEFLKEQHLGLATLRALEAGSPHPRIVAARVCACLGLDYAAAKGEIQ